jgi:hypothetical protein
MFIELLISIIFALTLVFVLQKFKIKKLQKLNSSIVESLEFMSNKLGESTTLNENLRTNLEDSIEVNQSKDTTIYMLKTELNIEREFIMNLEDELNFFRKETIKLVKQKEKSTKVKKVVKKVSTKAKKTVKKK